MKLTKETLIVCAQECVNTYKGEYGKVVPVLKDKQEFDIGKVEWTIGYLSSDLFITFRGSDGKADWADNIEYEQVNYSLDHTIKLHKGFYKDQYLLARDQILNIVFSYMSKNPNGNIIISGHSLGGALAIIAAFDIKVACNNFNVTCVSFASPRVGNSNFTKEFNKLEIDTYLFRYKNDTVTQVPFPIMISMKKTCVSIFDKDIYRPTIIRYSRVKPLIKLGHISWYERFLKRTTNPFNHYPMKYLKTLDKLTI